MPWARRQTRPIPTMGAGQSTLELNDYSKGMDNFISNDAFPLRNNDSNKWRLAQDARITSLGEYETRKGTDFYTAAAGETMDTSQTATTGASHQAFGMVQRLAQSWTAVVSGSLSKYEVRLKNDAGATGTVMVEHWTDNGGVPGEMVAQSSIAGNAVGSSYDYLTARFVSAPEIVAATKYWIVVYTQQIGSGSYYWSSTTAATTGATSASSGASWAAASFALNFKQHYATTGECKGLYRCTKSDGTKLTLFAHGTVLYSVNDVTGALTSVKTGLNALATHYRFTKANDVIYYVNGYNGYRKWDFTTESQITATNYTNIINHKGLNFLQRADDANRVDFTNFGEYDTITSTDFIYVPSPNTGDPNTAMLPLNGYLIIWTRNNKFILSGDDNSTFQLDEAPDQNGTFSQETVTKDDNYVYYLSATGVYRSNGSEPMLISKNIYEEVRQLPNKGDACIAISRGRLYLFHQAIGSAVNNRCYVWNLNFGTSDYKGVGSFSVESIDLETYVGRAVNAPENDDSLIIGSSKVGQLYWQELDSNDYDNLGGPLSFALHTHYFTLGSPSRKKEIREWKARFGASSEASTVSCQYAYDLRNNAQTQQELNIQGTGALWGAATTIWGTFTWGSSQEVEASLTVPGEYRRVQIRYTHTATRQPVQFLGHTFVIQVRRMK